MGGGGSEQWRALNLRDPNLVMNTPLWGLVTEKGLRAKVKGRTGSQRLHLQTPREG